MQAIQGCHSPVQQVAGWMEASGNIEAEAENRGNSERTEHP